jgi:diguanylate cyclase (GGDEF)-like protein
METRHLLLAFILLTHGLTTGMWWVAGTWMGLSRRAARYWMLSSLAMGLGLVLMVLYESGPPSFRLLTACSLAVLGVVWLRQGLQAFLRIKRTEGANLALSMGTMAVNVLVCLPMGWTTQGVALSCLAIGGLLLRSAQEVHRPLKIEFHPAAAWTASGMMGFGVVVFVVSAALNLQQQSNMQAPMDALEQFWLVFSSVALSIVGSFVLGYIVIMRMVQRLEHLSQHDALTGLLNRRAIEQLLDREAQRLLRFNEPFTVLLIDIDHFKRINDRYGHAAGDVVLREVAIRLQAQAREVDRVARYGGEEFCVLLPHTVHEGAWQAAERLREAVCHHPIVWGEDHISVTISMGLACASDCTETLQSLLKRADEALYEAKAGGRNRVVTAWRRNAA